MAFLLKTKYYYAMHQLAFLKWRECIDSSSDTDEIFKTYSNEMFYGSGYHSDAIDTLGGVIRKFSEQSKLKKFPSGRKLYEYKLAYNQALQQGKKEMEFVRGHEVALLKFINSISFEDALRKYWIDVNGQSSIIDVEEKYIELKSDKKFNYSSKINARSKIEFHDNLNSICANPNWYLYTYDYNNLSGEDGSIMRLRFKITKENDDYIIQLFNSGAPYQDYRGRVIHSTSNLFICDLTGGSKRYMIHVSLDSSGTESLYTGIYLKNNNDGKLFSGSLILERVENSVPHKDLQARVIRRDTKFFNTLHPGLQKFFKSKERTFLKTSRKYNYSDLNNWVDNKEKSRNEYKEFSLFISATIMSLDKRKLAFETLSNSLTKYAKSIVRKEISAEKIERNIKKILEEEYLGRRITKELPYDPPRLLDKVNELEELIKANVPFKKDIYNSRRIIDPNTFKYRDPKKIHKDDYEKLRKSEAFMVICPYKNITSAAWVMLGWAMMISIPIIIIVHKKEEDLPSTFLADMKSEYIHIHEIDSIDEIPDLWKWFDVNKGDQHLKKLMTEEASDLSSAIDNSA